MLKRILREVPWLLLLFFCIGMVTALVSKDPAEQKMGLYFAGVSVGLAVLIGLFFLARDWIRIRG